jgi:hypothetical protein
MRKCALITGITGQAGSYSADLLLANGYEVRGLKCRSSSFKTGRIDHLYFDPHTGEPPLLLHYCEAASIVRKIREVQPEEIYNLAAQSRYHGNHDGVERVACPRSGTRPGTDQQPGGGPPAKCLRARGDDPPRPRRYLCRPGLGSAGDTSWRCRIRGAVPASKRNSNEKDQRL